MLNINNNVNTFSHC